MGDLGRSQVVSSSSVTESVFSFLAEQCNSFAILPHLASCCLEFSEVCQHFGSFSLVVDSNSVIIVIVTVVLIKSCCIVVWQTKCIQCARMEIP